MRSNTLRSTAPSSTEQASRATTPRARGNSPRDASLVALLLLAAGIAFCLVEYAILNYQAPVQRIERPRCVGASACLDRDDSQRSGDSW